MLAFALLLYYFWNHWDQERFEEWKTRANPFVFFGMLAVLPLLLVPVTPFFVAAGAVFPTWLAILGSAVGMAINCLLNHALARAGWLNWMKRWINRSEDALLRENPKRLLKVAVLIKLAPALPTTVKNTILALSGLPFRWYFALCWGMSMAYAVVLIVLGDSIVEANLSRLIPALVALALLGVAVAVVRRRLKSRSG